MGSASSSQSCRQVLDLSTNQVGIIAASLGSHSVKSLVKSFLQNIYDGSIISVGFQHRAKIVNSEWIQSEPRQQCLLQLAVSRDDATASIIETSSNGIKWV